MIKAFVFDAYGTLFDTQCVTDVITSAFPGRADYISPVWRMKQLDYSWLRSMMGRYADFWTVTREALEYALRTAELSAEQHLFERVADAYNRLDPYPDAIAALQALSGFRLAIPSNGSPEMLSTLVRHSGLDAHLDKVMSVDPQRAFKPDPRAYELIEEELGLSSEEVVFVSSNGFDVCGATHFGLIVKRIERIERSALAREVAETGAASPAAIFKAMRSQIETCGDAPNHIIKSLADLPALAATLEVRPIRT